ncbi:MAG: SDR family oxidoreductase [Armatimonadota bacterium]|nr:SDR family oxidoreductase [Armatimonadota bacterium]
MTTVVTGATSGIGKATALELHSRGIELVLSGRNRERLEQISKSTGNSPVVAGDICDPEVCASLFENISDGRVNAVFAAGTADFGPTLEFPAEKWKAAIDANLTGIFNCCRSAIKVMLPRGGGKIIAVLSIAAKHPFPQSAAYVASKAGALGLVRSLQAEFREQDIAITAFIPGSTATELWHRQDWSPTKADMIAPQDVGKAISDIILADSSAVYDEVVFMPKKGIL